jgi:hypothetical protein
MREQIGLLFKDCKNNNQHDFAKFNNSDQQMHRLCKISLLKIY